ncbi:hypothetical protein LguiA_027107 [Lonicera macranthoides]
MLDDDSLEASPFDHHMYNTNLALDKDNYPSKDVFTMYLPNKYAAEKLDTQTAASP